MEFGNQFVTGKEATRMRCSHPASFHQQVNFLRRQLLQDDDLPFTDVLTEEVIGRAHDGDQRLVGPDLFWSIGRLDGVVIAVVAVEPASAHSTVLRKDAAMGQDGHACMASAETSRNSFSVAPLAA